MTENPWLAMPGDQCSIHRTLEVIGERWTLHLIRDAANGVHRFNEFRRHVGLSEAVLAKRLRTLVAAGIFETHRYRVPGARARDEYRLTDTGWELLPVLIALMQWSDAHLTDGRGAPWAVRHRGWGHRVRAVVQCTHDHRTLTYRDTTAGPVARAT